jgi:glycosyltransferase involved in cell wall biosynthesis
LVPTYCRLSDLAIARELAPIATSGVVAPFAITSGENGIIVPLFDANAIADAVGSLSKGAGRRLEMRKFARGPAPGYYWPADAKLTLDAYSKAYYR